jgi:uncharacterized protein
MAEITQSPCVRNCCLDDDDTCLGCFRSLQEIKEWGIADERRRLDILENASRREAARQKRKQSSGTQR